MIKSARLEIVKAFVDGEGLDRPETEAATAVIRKIREAAYPLI